MPFCFSLPCSPFHFLHFITYIIISQCQALQQIIFYSENMIYLSCSTNRLIVKIENEMSLILQLGKYFYSVQLQISKLDQLNET